MSENAFENLDEKTKQDLIQQKLDFALEGIVNIIKLLDELKKSQDSANMKINNLLNVVGRNQSYAKDAAIISSSVQTDIDDIKTDIQELNSRFDNVDNEINNIKIYKMVGGEF